MPGRTFRGTQTQLTVLSVLTILGIIMSAVWMYYSLGTVPQWFVMVLTTAALGMTIAVMIVIIARRA